MQYPNWLAGQRVTAALLLAAQPTFVIKTAVTDRSSTTTLTADPDLQFAVVANGVYLVEFELAYGGTATEQIKTDWSVPSGATGIKAGVGIKSGEAANGFADGVSSRYGYYPFATTNVFTCVRTGTGNLQVAKETGIVTVASTAGTVALRWAQNTSTANTMRMGVGAWGRCTRIG